MPRCVKKFTFTLSFNFCKNFMKRYLFPILQRNKLRVVCSIAPPSLLRTDLHILPNSLKSSVVWVFISQLWQMLHNNEVDEVGFFFSASAACTSHMTDCNMDLFVNGHKTPRSGPKREKWCLLGRKRFKVAFKLDLEEQRGMHFKWKKMQMQRCRCRMQRACLGERGPFRRVMRDAGQNH